MNNTDYQSFEDFILDESFHEYVTGSSEASVSFWKNWLTLHPEKEIEVRKATKILTTLFNKRKLEVPSDKNEALNELLNRIEKSDKIISSKKNIFPSWVKVAAVVAFSIGLASLWNLTNSIFKGKERIVFNEIIVPIGEKSQIVLSDGTHVWINSGSKFKYPVSFGKNSREVYLTGEAFFDVTHHEKQSFVVNTHDSRVKVLGTAFNVKAYPEDEKTQTTVVRGLVSVQTLRNKEKEVLIRPNQMAVIRKDLSKVEIRANETLKPLQIINNINVEAITCWKNQLLVFADEPLEDMALKMERWFNVRIVIDSTLRKERYNGKFVHNETIYEVLEAIKQTTPIKYSVEDSKIFISRNKVKNKN